MFCIFLCTRVKQDLTCLYETIDPNLSNYPTLFSCISLEQLPEMHYFIAHLHIVKLWLTVEVGVAARYLCH